MGKKSKNKNDLPFVSICTPTFNRRPFIKSMIKCFEHQTYPKDKMEWIIIDDGTDKIEDLVSDISNVKYFKYNEKMPLGKKRNLMHEKSVGDIIVYMDDDDYYPPERVSHAVDMLQTHPKALCAGASEIYIYFKHIDKMYQFGPYGPNHATAGTFAFKRELLKEHKYEDHAALAEEKAFLKNYTVPFVQLEPKKTILVFSHIQNTFDKKKLLNNKDPRFVKESDKTVKDFVKQSELENFYKNEIDKFLRDYKPGDPGMKPDVISQMAKMEKEREEMSKQMAIDNNKMLENQENILLSMGMKKEVIENLKNNPNECIKIINENQKMIQMNQLLLNYIIQSSKSGKIVGNINGIEKELSNDEIVNVLQEQTKKLNILENECKKKDIIINSLKNN